MTGTPSSTALVVGGGIVGAACALYLSRAGFGVTVIDEAFPGSGATGAGMGHLVAMDDSEAQFALTLYSISLWRELFAEEGAFAEVESCGTLWIAEDEPEYTAVVQKYEFYMARGVEAQVLDEKDTATCEPMLRPLAGALRVPGDAVVYPPSAAVTFLDIARRHGAKLICGWRASHIGSNVVAGPSGSLGADVVVNAAGNACGALSKGVELRPRRGHLVITDRYPGAVRHQIVELGYLRSAHEMSGESVAFNVQPRATGQLLIGSSRELGAADNTVNPRILSRMLERARHFMPTLAGLSATRVWTGSRPTTADKLPFIGLAPGGQGVWVAAGHEGLGITTSLATGKLISDMITGATPAIDVAPFDPSRPGTAAWH